MKFLDVTNDFYLRRGMELERQRERALDHYQKSKNPKALDQVNKLTKECNNHWKMVRLRDFQRYSYEAGKKQQKGS